MTNLIAIGALSAMISTLEAFGCIFCYMRGIERGHALALQGPPGQAAIGSVPLRQITEYGSPWEGQRGRR